MGDINQTEFMKQNAHLANKGVVLEIGSKDYGSTPDYRKLFPSSMYVGVDLSAGKGVDVVADVSWELEDFTAQVGREKFDAIIIFSVLEHCLNVHKICVNIEKLLSENGTLFVSVPFSWEYHGFPDDYWRFTPQAVKALFPNILFNDELTKMSTSRAAEVKPADDEFYKIDLSSRVGLLKKRYNMPTACLIKVLRAIPVFREVFDYPFLMPPVLVSMVGKKAK